MNTKRRMNRILAKENKTAKDIGKLLVLTYIDDLENIGNPERELVVTQEQINEMYIEYVQTEREHKQFLDYSGLFKGLIASRAKVAELHNSFYRGQEGAYSNITEVINNEEDLRKLVSLPVTMREEEYRAFEARLYKYVEDRKISYNAIFNNVLCYFMEEVTSSADVPEEVARELQKAKVPKVGGYYQLENGTRSDLISKEAWRKELDKDFMALHGVKDKEEIYLARHDLKLKFGSISFEYFYKGLDNFKKAVESYKGSKPLLQPVNAVAMFELIEQMPIEELWQTVEGGRLKPNINALNLERIVSNGDTLTSAVWHEYNAEENIGIEEALLYAFPVEILRGIAGLNQEQCSKLSTEEYNKVISDAFRKNYPAVAGSLDNYLLKIVEGAGQRKNNEEAFFSLSDLIQKGVPSMEYGNYINSFSVSALYSEALPEENLEQFVYKMRAKVNAPLVISKGLEFERLFDNDALIDYAEDFAPWGAEEKTESALKNFKYYTAEFIEPATKYFNCYNSLIDILASLYELKELEHAKLDIKAYERTIRTQNNAALFVYTDFFGNQPIKERKRQLFESLDILIDAEALKPSPEAVETLAEKLKELRFSEEMPRTLENFNSLINLLLEQEGSY